MASCIYKQRRHDDAAVGANDAHEDHHYTKERAQQGFAPEKSDAGAHGESRRRGHRPSGTRGKHPRAEQTCKDGAERRQPERWRSAKQAELEEKVYHVSAGGGNIEVEINGKKEITAVTLKPEVVDPDDIEFLQDLIREGVNEAIRACNADAEQTIGAITGGLELGL